MSRCTYILRSAPGELTFFDTFRGALDQLKKEHGMEFKYALFEEGADDLARHVYWEAQERAILNLVEDFDVSVRYLIIEAASQEDVEHLGERLGEFLPFIPLAELQEEARQKMMDDPQVVVRMALGTNELSDPVSLEILRNGLSSDNELVRFRAAAAASLTQWTEFLEELRQMNQNDPSPEVQEMARRAVEACQRRVQAEETASDGGT